MFQYFMKRNIFMQR